MSYPADSSCCVVYHTFTQPTVWPKYFKGENFHGFYGFMSNLENFNLENFVLHYISILCFCNPRNIYHKNTKSHESTKILTLEIFRLYGITINPGMMA